MNAYLDRLSTLALARRSLLCVSIDPSPEVLSRVLPSSAARHATDVRRAHAWRAEMLGMALVAAASQRAVAVKPQMAWFELAGAAGMAALEQVCTAARDAELLVVLDGKRGDVPQTMAGYAQAYLGEEARSGICADALTMNASLGGDALDACMSVARERDAYVYALAHTSNPGSSGLQDAVVGEDPWWHLLCAEIDRVGAGAVVGATYPKALVEARALMPRAGLLIPGVGAQGGQFDALEPLKAPIEQVSPALVAASRSLLPDRAAASVEDLAQQCEELVARHADATWTALVPEQVPTG